MDKKDITVVIDESSARESPTAKAMKEFRLEKMGRPSVGFPPSVWFPPGTVIAAANATVAMSDAATVHEVAMLMIHCVSYAAISRCSSLKIVSGVFPSEFFDFLS